jgi:precorrin-2/cobalt-factor-2 C20-methyltransferase
MNAAPGTLYGVGVGPGDPELLTRKAVRILESVHWIYAPAAARREGSYAADIIASLGLPRERLRQVALAMSRDRQADVAAYESAAHDILGHLREGQDVAWITEGDPLLYSTFLPIYERVRRNEGVPIEIVPGITSFQAAAARAGVPIARRGETVAIVPAAYGLEHLSELVEQHATVFLLKVHSVFEELLERLARLPVRVWYAENLGRPGERVLGDPWSLRGQGVRYFSLLIVQRRDQP